jgi:hypothetical protein
MLFCIVQIKRLAAALERLEAPPLDHALQAAAPCFLFPPFRRPAGFLSTAYPPPQ